MEPTKAFMALNFEHPETSIFLADQAAVDRHKLDCKEHTDGNVHFKYVPLVTAYYAPQIMQALHKIMENPIGVTNDRSAYNIGKSFPLSPEVQASADRWQPFQDLLNLIK